MADNSRRLQRVSGIKDTKKNRNMQTNLQVIQLTEERYRENLQQAAQLGAHLALLNAGLPVREYFSRQEMCKRHGRGTIERLIKAGKLTPHQKPAYDNNTHKQTVYSETEYLSQII